MFTKEEIKTLWDNLDLEVQRKGFSIWPVDLILISIYTGIRPLELLALENENINLEDRYIKIINGKNGDRIIPIHDDIYPLVETRKENGYYTSFAPLSMSQYIYIFKSVMEQLGMKHSIHDCRRTYFEAVNKGFGSSTMQQALNFREDSSKTPEELVEAINKIDFK